MKTTKRWKPKDWEEYFVACLNNDAMYRCYKWGGYSSDNKNFRTGNCFRTKREAIAAAKAVKKLLLGLHDDGKEF